MKAGTFTHGSEKGNEINTQMVNGCGYVNEAKLLF